MLFTRVVTSTLMLASTVALVSACGGDKQSASPAETAASAAAPATPAPAAGAPATVASAGEAEYQRCAVCHQPTGAGVPGAFPPLAGSEWATGKVDRPIAILLHGLQGAITVKGATFTNAMMPYGTGVEMSDDQIAAVLTYVRTSWGNAASAVTAADVARVRAATKSRSTQWTVAELEAMK